MASEEDAQSDVSSGDRPVREKLQNASINPDLEREADGTDKMTVHADDLSSKPPGVVSRTASPNGTSPNKLAKKRSHEDMDDDCSAQNQPTGHVRKRSRDETSEEREARPETPELKADSSRVAGEESIASPKLKKTRHRLSEVHGSAAQPVDTAVSEITQLAHDQSTPTGTVDVPSTTHVESSAASEPASATTNSKTEDAIVGVTKDAIPSEKEHAPDKEEENTTGHKKEDAVNRDREDVTNLETSSKEESGHGKILLTSGFANASSTSPFGALAGEKSSLKSQSAFASGGFGAAASSATSGFATTGKSLGGFGSGGSFATGTKSPLNGNAQAEREPPGSMFGGALGQKSAFAAVPASGNTFGGGASILGKHGEAAGNGSLGSSGFGSLAKAGGGLTSFASGKHAAQWGTSTKPAKAFGALSDEEDDPEEVEYEEGDGDGDGPPVKSTNLTGEEKQDKRFFEQDIETGEEDESTLYTCRAKLYNFGLVKDEKKAWKERGHGTIRLNVKKAVPGVQDGVPQARLVMRVDGSHKVALNTPVKKEIKFGTPKGGPPEGPYIFFMGAILNEDGKSEGLELLQLKVKPQYALELHELVLKLQQAM